MENNILNKISNSNCCCDNTKKPIITELVAESVIEHDLFKYEDPARVDRYIRIQLAQQLAHKLIDEDLVSVQVSDDMNTMEHKVRATIKIIQE